MFGVVGLVGVKCIDIVEIIFGVCEKVSGVIKFYGKEICNCNVFEVINNGFVLVIEECCFIGIYVNLSIEFNFFILNMKLYLGKFGLLSNKKMKSDI